MSHNGGLIPVPGRDLYVQGWYQGGIDVMDFTDADHPKEIAYFDRGPIDPPPGADVRQRGSGRAAQRCTIGGSWGAYYWNGRIYSSELDRGFDILELTPSPQLSANEIAAAKLVTFKEYNPRASRSSSGRRRSSSCGRISTSSCATTASPPIAPPRSRPRSTRRRRRAGGACRGAHDAREAGGRRRERGERRAAREEMSGAIKQLASASK